MPSRASTSFLLWIRYEKKKVFTICVNALTGLYLIATNKNWEYVSMVHIRCQCPHGLIPHCYPIKPKFELATVASVNALTGLYLIATKYRFFYDIEDNYGVNALTGLYLIATMDAAECTYPLEKVSMPSRAYTSLLP